MFYNQGNEAFASKIITFQIDDDEMHSLNTYRESLYMAIEAQKESRNIPCINKISV